MAKISIVEDNKYLRAAWEVIVETSKNHELVEAFETAEDALRSETIVTSDVLLLDISLPGKSGIELLEVLLKKNDKLLAIMISVHDDDHHIYEALCFGALGYLNKNIKSDELLDSIDLVLSGGSPMSPNIARKVIRKFHQKPSADVAVLSIREREILQKLSVGHSYKMIADDLCLSIDGVRYHIRNIYHKLQVSTKSEAVKKWYKGKILSLLLPLLFTS